VVGGGGGGAAMREAVQRVMLCSVVCLHCRAEAEAWMLENPPEAYRSKPWPALQSAPSLPLPSSDSSRVAAQQVRNRHAEQHQRAAWPSGQSPFRLRKRFCLFCSRLNPVLQRKTPLDVLKRLAALTRQPVAPSAVIKATAAAAPHETHSSHTITAAAAGAAAAAIVMRGLSLLRRR
jgi:hypothetical protein